MEELSTIFGNVGLLVAALAGGISLVMFGFAGIQYMTAQGDPQGMSRAKMSVIGAVVAEFIGAHSGLGRLIIVAQTRLETVTMLAAIIWLAVLGVGVYFLIEFIERRAIRWHVSRRLEETHLT